MKNFKLYFFSFIYLISGLLSTWLFHQDDNEIMPNGLYPGLIFILTTIICLVQNTKLTFVQAIKFSTLTYLSYLIIFFITLYSSFAAMLVGIFAGGIGSLSVFYLINKYIRPIYYDKILIFGLGTIAFVINDIIIISPIREIAPDYFRRDMTGNFSSIFLIWQFIIGIKLSKTLLDT